MAKNFNPAVLIWASGKVGQSVAGGECWDLANSALQKAGAGTSSDFGPAGDDADYVWGDEVSDLKDALPGDILQYRDFSQTSTTTTTAVFKDGFEQSDAPSAEISRPHHTAIISKNPGNGALTVLEQTYDGNKEKTKSTAIRWKDAATKTTVTKKMVKREDTGKSEMATVTVVAEVSVSGTLTAFRPKAK